MEGPFLHYHINRFNFLEYNYPYALDDDRKTSLRNILQIKPPFFEDTHVESQEPQSRVESFIAKPTLIVFFSNECQKLTFTT